MVASKISLTTFPVAPALPFFPPAGAAIPRHKIRWDEAVAELWRHKIEAMLKGRKLRAILKMKEVTYNL